MKTQINSVEIVIDEIMGNLACEFGRWYSYDAVIFCDGKHPNDYETFSNFNFQMCFKIKRTNKEEYKIYHQNT